MKDYEAFFEARENNAVYAFLGLTAPPGSKVGGILYCFRLMNTTFIYTLLTGWLTLYRLEAPGGASQS